MFHWVKVALQIIFIGFCWVYLPLPLGCSARESHSQRECSVAVVGKIKRERGGFYSSHAAYVEDLRRR
jgi:hypothetical protein